MAKLRNGLYKHYKGDLIILIGVSIHSETLEKFATYIHLGKDSKNKENNLWIRPIDMFLRNVEVNNKLVPRFKYIGEK